MTTIKIDVEYISTITDAYSNKSIDKSIDWYSNVSDDIDKNKNYQNIGTINKKSCCMRRQNIITKCQYKYLVIMCTLTK